MKGAQAASRRKQKKSKQQTPQPDAPVADAPAPKAASQGEMPDADIHDEEYMQNDILDTTSGSDDDADAVGDGDEDAADLTALELRDTLRDLSSDPSAAMPSAQEVSHAVNRNFQGLNPRR